MPYPNRWTVVLALLVLITMPFGAVLAAEDAAATVDAYTALKDLESGLELARIEPVMALARSAVGEQRVALEEQLLKLVQDGEATLAGRRQACRMLRLAGSDRSVPVLAGYLADPDLAHMARFALEGIPGHTVDRALLTALPASEGDLRIGIISSLSKRRTEAAAKPLYKLASDGDAATTAAAITALGNIGTQGALRGLLRLDVGDDVADVHQHALLVAADTLAQQGKTRPALKTYEALWRREELATPVRIAALRGMVNAEARGFVQTLAEACQSLDPKLRVAAAAMVSGLPEGVSVEPFAKDLAALPADTQIVILTALAGRGDASVVEVIKPQIDSLPPASQKAAILAMGRLGDEALLPYLMGIATSDHTARGAAFGAVASLGGEGTAEAIRAYLGGEEPAVREAAARLIRERNDVEAFALLVRATADDDQGVRREAFGAMGAIAGPEEAVELVAILAADTGDSLAQRAVVDASRRLGKGAPIDELNSALGAAEGEDGAALIKVLAGIEGQMALDVIAPYLDDPALAEVAVRALSGWKSEQPTKLLIAFAARTDDLAISDAAMRGAVRTAVLPRNTRRRLELLTLAAAAADNRTERAAVLGGLGQVHLPGSLEQIAAFFEDAELTAEARAAAMAVVGKLNEDQRKAAAAWIEKIPPEADEATLTE